MEEITLMDAYLIETIRNEGFTDEDIIEKAKNNRLEEYEELHENFDFTELYDLVKNGTEKLEAILYDGYRISFLTFPGLINLLQLKYNKIEDRDYEVDGFVISKLQLQEDEAAELRTWLARNWKMTEEEEGIEIKPVHT